MRINSDFDTSLHKLILIVEVLRMEFQRGEGELEIDTKDGHGSQKFAPKVQQNVSSQETDAISQRRQGLAIVGRSRESTVQDARDILTQLPNLFSHSGKPQCQRFEKVG